MHTNFIFVDRLVVVHRIAKENVLQNDIHAKKWAFLVRENVILSIGD